MLKLCARSISKPLHILSNNSVINECFLNELKKANIIPVHKKGDKQIIKNYQPISLLSICSKIFGKIIFKSLFKYLEDNKLLNCNQSGFPARSFMCASASLNNTQNLQIIWRKSLTWSKRCVLDISKAFDRVWHDGLLYKLKLLGICGRYYSLMQSFSNSKHQRVVLNGHHRNGHHWNRCSTSLISGSATLPYLWFALISINDLPQELRSNAELFADDTLFFLTITAILYYHQILMKTYLK